MSCGTCGIQASNTMQEDTGVPAGAPQSQRPRCPACKAFVSQEGAPCHNPRCPALAPADGVFQGDNQLTQDNVRVTWEDIGEGYGGDYDPDDPDDTPLLRFYVQRRDPQTGAWEDVEDASYCTNMPVAATPAQRRRGLQVLMRQFHDPVLTGESVKKLGEEMSGIGLDDVAESAPPLGSRGRTPAAAPAVLAAQVAYGNAYYNAGGPADDTRAAACLDPHFAYLYARDVDQEPRDDTRAAACKHPGSALAYARDVDQAPRDDTRQAACRNPFAAFAYAQEVDAMPHADTRQAAQQHPDAAQDYADWEATRPQAGVTAPGGGGAPTSPPAAITQYELDPDTDLGNVSLTDQMAQYQPTPNAPVLLHEPEADWSRLLVQAGEHAAAATIESDTVALDVRGYGPKSAAPGYGGGLAVLHFPDNQADPDAGPVLLVWANRRSAQPSHRIALRRAAESRRHLEQDEQDETASAPLWQAVPHPHRAAPVTDTQGRPAIQGHLDNRAPLDQRAVVAVTAELGGLTLDIKGYGVQAGRPGHGGGVAHLDLTQAHPVLYVWADMRQEDPTDIIDLSGAAEKGRN